MGNPSSDNAKRLDQNCHSWGSIDSDPTNAKSAVHREGQVSCKDPSANPCPEGQSDLHDRKNWEFLSLVETRVIEMIHLRGLLPLKKE